MSRHASDNLVNNAGSNLDNDILHDRDGVLRLRIPDGRAIEIRRRVTEHPIFGQCDAVALISDSSGNASNGSGDVLARCQAVDWDAPTHIPPLDVPGALPGGAGTAILNLLARRARGPLRYHGPYPTGALFDSLLECFQVADPVRAFQEFNAHVEDSALSATMREVPVDFEPAPFRRIWHPHTGVCVQLRDGVEKVFVNGRAYARTGTGARRLRPEVARSGGTLLPPKPENWLAVVEIGNHVWANIVHVSNAGTVLAGPWPLPAVTSPAVGRPLPAAVRAALAQALPARAPRLMQAMLSRILATTPLEWGDTRDELAAASGGRILVHAVLLENLAEAPPIELLEAIARAVEPVAQRLAQAALARAIAGELP